MSVLPDFPFKYSRIPGPDESRPCRYFNILPYRVSSLGDEHFQVGFPGLAELVGLMGTEGTETLRKPAVTKQDHLLKWALPELSPDDLRLLAPCLDLMLRIDGAIDVLDHKTQENLLDDLILSILSLWILGSPPDPHLAQTGKLVEFLLSPIITGRPDQTETFLKTLLAAASAQPVQADHEMSFEQFTKLRADSVGAKTGFDFAMSFQGYRISDEERSSIAHLLEYGYISIALSNDYYSFEKEYRNHEALGTIDYIHNAVALLMRNYGYTESEARDILKSEILDAERKLLDGYKEWEASSKPVSDTLRAYLEFFILTIGGSNYWQSSSIRYFGDDTGHCKDVETRFLGKAGRPLLKLKGYAPPAGVGVNGDSSVDESSASQHVEQQSDERNGNDGVNSNTEFNILTPFQKADAGENCTSPYTYTKSLPGKNTLRRFVESLTPWFRVSDNSLSVIKDAMTMLFTSSLMLDDIEDGSHLRRGLPAAHLKYGLSQTVNSATYVFGKATGLIAQHLRPGCLSVAFEELEILMSGQGMDLNWTFRKKCPTVSEYLVMIDHKTGGLFRLALQLMQVDADVPCNDNLMHLITLIGRYYQICDDYQNVASEEYTAKKGFCDDLSEGKFSFPLIHLLQSSSNADVLRQLPIFGTDGQRGDVSEETKQQILDEMERTGSLEHTLDVLNRLFDSILSTLDAVEAEMGQNRKLRCLILLLKL